jgi:hypothetical protein
MTFLLSEDEALRNLLLGMTVVDQKSTNDNTSRSVKVYFGQPDQEIREQSYPYVTIDMIDIAEDPARAHRGLVKPDYLPNPTSSPSGTGTYDADENDWYIHYPIPVNIDYQVKARRYRARKAFIYERFYSESLIRDCLTNLYKSV